MPAAVEAVHVSAEHSITARLDGAHDHEPGGVDAPFAALTEIAVPARLASTRCQMRNAPKSEMIG